MQTTRSLWLPDTIVLSWSGVGMFQLAADGSTQSVQSYAASGSPYMFYEVSVVGDLGSWWSPTGPSSPAAPWGKPQLGGVVNLQASGVIVTEAGGAPLVRAASTFVWVPAATLATTGYLPMVWEGAVAGTFPTSAPGGGGAKYRLDTLADGILLTVLTPEWKADLQANTIRVIWPAT